MLKERKYFVWCLVFLVCILAMNFGSAEHLILGGVNDSYGGEGASGKTAVLWNSQNGITDNLTDVVSALGNYDFDCEQLLTPCSEGDNLSIRIISGSVFWSAIQNITVTAVSPDYVDDIRLNSKPTINLVSPENESFSDSPATFNCSYNDLDSETINVYIYSNISGGGFSLLDSDSGVSGNLVNTTSVSDGNYAFYCVGQDALINTISDYNYFTVDSTDPVISDFSINDSYFCGNGSLILNCTVTDDNLDEVYFEINGPETDYNLTSSFGSNYYAVFLVNETGNYSSRCVAVDSANNTKYSSYENFTKDSAEPDLFSGPINFTTGTFSEGEILNVSVLVKNLGCVASGTFSVGFYEDSVASENLLDNYSMSLSSLGEEYVTFNFTTLIGTTNYWFFADYLDSISESNESNNQNSSSYSINSWHTFYGNITAVRKLADAKNYNIENWGTDNVFSGNIFVADIEADISWTSLVAIGKTSLGGTSTGDFSEIDSVLGTTTYSDSVSNTYSSPEYLWYFFDKKNVTDVPSVVSRSGAPFSTGILWDSSDSVGDNEFDSLDKEDLVFVSAVELDEDCSGDICDYEIQIPAKLREYDTSQDSQKVYLYYNLE